MSTHVARIVKIDSVAPIIGADRIQTAYILGLQVIVSKDVQVGDLGILFDGELALSQTYLYNNNLYREKINNLDKEKAGFFDNNGKVRVQKFLKVKSEGLFMPITSVAYTGCDLSALTLGCSFDELNSVKICEKYISEKTRRLMGSQGQKKTKNFQVPLFKEHCDSEQLSYYFHLIPAGSVITVEHKWHGTSGRTTNTKVVRNEKIKEESSRYIRSIGKNINSIRYVDSQKESFEFLAGSRRVVLFPDENKNKMGYHGSEQYRFDILDMFKPYLTQGMTIFFEIVGYVNGGSIMGKHEMSKLKDETYTQKYGKTITYKYGCLPDQYKVKVYRIQLTTNDGNSVDFTSQQVQDWCEKRGFLVSTPLIPRFIYDGNKEKLMELVQNLAERPDKLCEDYVDPSHINEGVVVRVDFGGQTPMFLKYKSFVFKVLEGIAKEKGDLDIEEAS